MPQLLRHKYLPLLLVLGVVAWYFQFLNSHAMNIPQADDINDVLRTITKAHKATDIETFMSVMLEQHNDHKTLASRLVYWVSYLVQGEINFRTLNFLAGLGLVLILLILAASTRRDTKRWWIVLVAGLFLFQLRAYGLTLWSMAAFAFYFVYVYGFAALFTLNRATPLKLLVAMIFATAGTFTLASGQVVWLVGLVSLLHQCVVLRRIPKFYVLVWLLVALSVLCAWRIGLETPNTIAQMLRLLLETPLHHAKYFLVLLGGAVGDKSVLAAGLAGALLFAAVVFSSVRCARQEDCRLELMCWYVILTVLATTLGRAPYSDLEYALGARNAFPSIVLLTAVWVLVASQFLTAKPVVVLLSLLVSSAYWGSSFKIYAEPMQTYTERRVAIFNRGNYWMFGTSTEKSNATVAEAIASGIYNPPPRPYPRPQIYGEAKRKKKAAM